MKTAIVGGRLITPERIIDDGILCLEDGKISGIVRGEVPEGAKVIHAGGNYVSPGFIDLHTHGGGEMCIRDSGEGNAVVIPVGAQGIYNQVAGSLAQQTGRHIHGGQRRMNEGGIGDVVEGNNRDILRDPYALFQKSLNNSVSNQVVNGNNGRIRLFLSGVHEFIRKLSACIQLIQTVVCLRFIHDGHHVTF